MRRACREFIYGFVVSMAVVLCVFSGFGLCQQSATCYADVELKPACPAASHPNCNGTCPAATPYCNVKKTTCKCE